MFINPSEIEDHLDLIMVCNDINLLLCGSLKYTTINNQCSLALKRGDVSTYVNKMVAKTYYKNVLCKKEEN